MKFFFDPTSAWYYPSRWFLIIILGLAIYGQAFGFGFVFDDNFFMLDNPYIRSFDHINQIWALLPKTRMMGIYSFALNYQMNHLNPQGYHIFNFIIHLIVVGLVWATSTVLFKIAGWVPSVKWIYQELPFAIALLFLVHPCQTQAVTYISQRFESMATMFYLACMYTYLCARLASLTKHKIFLFICSGICAVLGIFTKETAATIPLMILAIEFILLNRNPFQDKDPSLDRVYVVVIVLGVLFMFLFIKILGASFINEYVLFSKPSESHEGDIITSGKYMLTQMRVFLTFLRLLILPVNQNVDYDYPLSTGLFNPPLTFLGLWVIGFITFLIFKLRHQWPLIAFGLAWILITFSINTAPRVNVIFEHKLYLISFGFFLATVCFFSMVLKDRRILCGVLIVLIAVLSLVSYKRNHIWRNEVTLWEDEIQKSPHKARTYSNLGVFLGMQGQYAQALDNFNKAIAINPKFAESYNNRGNTYSKQGAYDQAIFDLKRAIALKPDYFEAHLNLGIVYDKRGLSYAKEGRFIQALSDFNEEINLNPGHAKAYINRGIILARQSNFAQAVADYNKAIEINPEDPSAYINRGTLYAQQGSFVPALADYDKALDLNPSFKEVYFNRAVVYYQLKQYNKAWKEVHNAQESGALVNPGFINELKKVSGRFM